MTPVVKIILTEAIKTVFFDDVVREALPTNPEDRTVLLAYLRSEKFVQTVSSHPNVITTEATA